MMGVSGCGKSLAVKTISSLWNIPLFRLDMNLVFSGLYGSPEEAFHRALKTIEAVAPAVLWIDEIENALGLDETGQKIASHIFSSFLTWMQEKPPLIFIAATANKIQALPAEIIRKGRFDEVFFCDLPTAVEREEIFRIHLARNGAVLDDYDFKMLQVMTDGWNGAEIEQAVISARTDAFYEKRPFSQRDLSNVIARIVPLSDTMEQQIKSIRSWAFSRATPASKFGKSAAKRL
jgi:SpoVK/Ycf46/Vps4 family AAA+-type ATPase